MIRKIVAAAALATLVSSPAFALNNIGFEDSVGPSPAGWDVPLGSLSSIASGTANVVQMTDEYDPTVQYNPGAITAMSGNNYGLMTLCAGGQGCQSSVAFTYNLGGPASNPGDILWMRLFTMDYGYDANNDGVIDYPYNDSIVATYFGSSSLTPLAVDTISVQKMADGSLGLPMGTNTDSNWLGFAVPTGTNAIRFVLTSDVDAGNSPIAALDYAAAPVPVPEADVSAMMLAGLGVLGMVARRRRAKAAI